MLSLPKFLINLSDQAARKTQGGDPVKIELLRFERAKEGGWKSYLALGDVLLTMNVPSDPLGHGDAVFLCEALATALRGAPPDQMALAGFSRADPKFVAPVKAELTAGPKQPTLGLPEPTEERRPVPPAVPPPERTNGSVPTSGELKPPRGRKPKPGWCRFRVVGSDPKTEVLIDALGLVAKWDHDGEPNDTYSGEEFLGPWSPGESKSTAECTRAVYAGSLNVNNHALWLCDGDQYATGKGQWVHVEALGRNPASLGSAPLGGKQAPPPELGKAPWCRSCGHKLRPNLPNNPEPTVCRVCFDAGKRFETPASEIAERARPLICCVCGWPLIPSAKDPQPVKCEECDIAGRGPKVAMSEIGMREKTDTEPPPEGAEHPPPSVPPAPFADPEHGTAADSPGALSGPPGEAAELTASEPFEPCRSCAFFVDELDGDPAECLHHEHAPNRFARPCSDRRPSRGK